MEVGNLILFSEEKNFHFVAEINTQALPQEPENGALRRDWNRKTGMEKSSRIR